MSSNSVDTALTFWTDIQNSLPKEPDYEDYEGNPYTSDYHHNFCLELLKFGFKILNKDGPISVKFNNSSASDNEIFDTTFEIGNEDETISFDDITNFFKEFKIVAKEWDKYRQNCEAGETNEDEPPRFWGIGKKRKYAKIRYASQAKPDYCFQWGY